MSPEYLAGIIDGEGCISLTSTRKRYFTLRVDVGMKNYTFLYRLHKIWGGKLIKIKSGYTFLRWNGPEAIRVMKAVYPFVFIKKKVIKEGFNSWKLLKKRAGRIGWSRRGPSITNEEISRLRTLSKSMSRINRSSCN